MTKDGEFEYTLASGETVTIFYEATYEIVDNGIGVYEYWGAKGIDRQLELECEDADVISVDNEDGENIYETLSPEEKKAVNQAAYDYAIDNPPDWDEVDDGYDYDNDRKEYFDRND